MKTLLIISTGKVFVFAFGVEDFHTLNKDAIFTITTAALQVVDRGLTIGERKALHF